MATYRTDETVEKNGNEMAAYSCMPGYYEYNVYDNADDSIVYTINDPGEIAADWKTKDDIRDFAEACFFDIEAQAEEKGVEIDVSSIDKEAFMDAVCKEMERQYGDELEKEQPKKSKSRGM